MIVFESTVQLLENWKYNPHEDPSSTLFLNAKLFAFIAYTKAFEEKIGIHGSSYTNTMMVELGERLHFAAGSDKNIKLATYASRCIDNEILMFLRKNKKRLGEVSFEDSINFDSEGNELKIEDIYGTEEDIIHRCIESEEEEKLLIEEILKLNDRDKSIICKRYGLFGEKELTQKELANKMSISQSYISRIERGLTVPSVATLYRIAAAMGLTVELIPM